MGHIPANTHKLNVALTWLRAGIAVLPVAAGTKRPALAAWREYQSRLPAEADVRRWFAFGSKYELAVICGWRGLVVLDFDEREAYAAWRETCDVKTYTVQTRRGFHAYLYADDARSFDVPGFEVRGPGRYVLTPPSLHPSGVRYEVFDGSPVASVARLADVLPAVQVEPVRATHIPGVLPTVAPVTSIAALKLKLSLLQAVRDVVELKSSDGGVGRWFVGCCPFHDDEHPSFWIDTERGRFGCRAPHCRAHRSGDVLDFLSLLRSVPVRQLLWEYRR